MRLDLEIPVLQKLKNIRWLNRSLLHEQPLVLDITLFDVFQTENQDEMVSNNR